MNTTRRWSLVPVVVASALAAGCHDSRPSASEDIDRDAGGAGVAGSAGSAGGAGANVPDPPGMPPCASTPMHFSAGALEASPCITWGYASVPCAGVNVRGSATTTSEQAWQIDSATDSQDGGFASKESATSEPSDWLVAHGFGFALPDGASVLGIRLRSSRELTEGVVRDRCGRLVKHDQTSTATAQPPTTGPRVSRRSTTGTGTIRGVRRGRQRRSMIRASASPCAFTRRPDPARPRSTSFAWPSITAGTSRAPFEALLFQATDVRRSEVVPGRAVMEGAFVVFET